MVNQTIIPEGLELPGRIRHLALFGALAMTLAVVSQDALAGIFDPQRLIDSKESLYNNIYIYRQGSYVSLTFGYNTRIYTESTYNTADPGELPVTYTRYMTVGLAYPKDIHGVLEIGFGGGRTSWYLHRALADVPVTSVELDPAVVEMAHKYFGIREDRNFKVECKDGRLFLSKSKERYDIIMIDAYRGPFVPFQLLTREFYKIVRDHLTPDGVVLQNVAPDTMLFDSAVKTIGSVFPQVEFYPAEGNVVTVAYLGPRKTAADLGKQADQVQNRLRLRYDLRQLVRSRTLYQPDTPFIDAHAKVLTDDFAPVDALRAIEQHNRKWPEPR